MARPKVKINANRGLRLKQICDEKGITQTQLSKLVNISQQAISNMINGNATVTETTAIEVIKVFPEYRYEWLMDFDNVNTKEEKKIQVWEQEGKITTSTVQLIAASFRQQGYEMKMCTPANVPEGYKFHNNDGYYLFGKGNDPIVISVDDYFKMEASILEFTEFVTSKYLKKEGKA